MRRHADRDVIILEDEGSSGLVWFLLGAALGAGAALLFAPTSGEEARDRIRRGARRLKDSAEDAFDELRDEVGELTDRAVEKVDEARAAVKGVAEDLKEGADTVRRRSSANAAREELERRLAEARARRRQASEEDQEPVA